MSLDANIIEYLIEVASKHPQRLALKDESEQCTYQELLEMVNCVASILAIQYGVKPEQRVAILTEKSVQTMVVFYAIMQSGAIPLLIDAKETKVSITAKCNAMDINHIVVPKMSQYEWIGNTEINTIIGNKLLDKTVKDLSVQSVPRVSCSDICYLINTSGTTDVPKGISVTHQNVMHYAKSMKETINPAPHLVCGHVTNLSTDLGYTNWLMALFTAGTLRLFSDNESRDARLFKKVIDEDGVNFIKTTRSHFETVATFLFKQKKTRLKYLILGGEKLQWEFVDKLFDYHISENIFNHYGPSETTIGVLMYRVPPKQQRNLITESVPIGSAIGENVVYLEKVDKGRGELIIEGPGVSEGYYKTAQNKGRFQIISQGRKRYRTGDLCREVTPGVFEFCKRKDRQVKVNGYRVELEEIEYIISSFDAVDYAKLNAFCKDGEVTLEAFVKPFDIKTFDQETFFKLIKEKLSSHKIPENIYIHEFCEFGGNGKINFEKMRNHKSYAENEKFNSWDSWELSVEHSWKMSTGTENIRMDDDFFETGGNSLKAMKFIAKLQINGYNVGIVDINTHTKYVDFLKLSRERVCQSNGVSESSTDRNYTFSQLRFFNEGWINNDRYTQSVLLETSGNIELDQLSKVINSIIEGHLELKRQFHQKKNVNFINDHLYGRSLEVFHLSGKTPISNQLIQITGNINERINIAYGEILKAAVIFEAEGDRKYLYLVGHHLATDMVSWNILLEEIITIYSSELDHYLTTEDLKKDFFQMDNSHIVLPNTPVAQEDIFLLPGVNRSGQSPKYGNILANYVLSSLKVNEVCQNNELLICFSRALLASFSLNKITIDVEFHGRVSDFGVDLSRSVSWWATTLPILFEKNEHDSDIEKKMASYSDYANSLNLRMTQGVRSNTKKSNVRFNFLGEINDEYSGENLVFKISSFPTASNRDIDSNVEYDLFFTGRITNDSLFIDVQYNQLVVSEEKVYSLINSLRKNLLKRGVLEYCNSMRGRVNAELMPSNVSTIGKPLLKLTGQTTTSFLPKSVMLTGATGYLGIYVLRELLLNGVKVHCIIRPEQGKSPFMRLQERWNYYFPEENFSKLFSGIFVYESDLCEHQFGLDNFDFEKLADETDAIVHSAADVNLSKRLENLLPANLEVVEKLIEFSAYKKEKRLHHISTLAVAGVHKQKTIFAEDTFEREQSFASDYEHSKFLAESTVRKAILKGAPFKVYRVGHIAAHSQTGKFQYNKRSNRITQLIEGMLELKAVPITYNEEVSFSNVDIVAKMLVNAVLNKVVSEKACLHLESSHYVTIPKLVQLLGESNLNLDIVDEDEFQNILNNYLQTNLETDKVLKMQFWLNRSKTNRRNVYFQNKYSNDLFARHGLVFPKLTHEWLDKYLNELTKNSVLRVEEGTNAEIKLNH